MPTRRQDLVDQGFKAVGAVKAVRLAFDDGDAEPVARNYVAVCQLRAGP